MSTCLRIASRNSPLALKQAEIIAAQLRQQHPQLSIDIIGMTTEGDRRLSMPLATVGGKGLFVKELEQALLEESADIAVHSMKDVPVELPHGLILHTVCEREDPRDVFVSEKFSSLADLPPGSCVGSSSLRRQCLLKTKRADIKVESLRGNIQTRLKKLTAGDYDGIILAAAGLKRLGLQEKITEYLAIEDFLPAVGQGTLGIECRAGDAATQALLTPLQDKTNAICLTAERSLNRALNGGCQVPIGAHATLQDDIVTLHALVGHPDGSLLLTANAQAKATDAKALGKQVAKDLLQQGAAKILQEIYS